MNCMPFTYDIYYSYWSYFKWPALLCFSCCWNRNSEEIVYKNCWCIWLFGSSESWRMYVLIMIILWIAGLLVVSTSYLKVFQWCECIDFVVADSTFTESVGIVFSYIFLIIYSPSVLLLCWLGSRKGIRPVKSEWWGTGYLSGVRCKWFAYGPADATGTLLSLAPVKSGMVYLSGAGLPRLSWKKGR